MEKFNYRKPLVIMITAVMLWIALAMMEGKIRERQQFRNQAEHSVAQSWTNSQTLIGPMIVVPYETSHQEKFWNKEIKRYQMIVKKESKFFYLLPDSSNINITLDSETRVRGIYPVPVYHANIMIEGQIDLTELEKLTQNPNNKITGAAMLSLSVTDSRGLIALPKLSINGATVKSLPGSQIPFAEEGFSTDISELISTKRKFNFQTEFSLNGMTSIKFMAVSKNQHIELNSDWPHPKFIGAFLPLKRTIQKDGYSASWQTSQYSLDFELLLNQCNQGNCGELFNNAFGVKQIEPIDIYRQAQRAVTYGILFIVVTFVAFALVELLKGIRLHPVQYGLAGANLSIFFLLLLAITEHLVFSLSYLIAATSVISLLLYYLLHSFKDKQVAYYVSTGIGLLYGVLYLIVQSEDHALLAGSLLLFGLLIAVIISTKNINWYRS